MFKLIVLYPQPKDVEQFEKDYVRHLQLLHEKTGLPASHKPYSITKMMPTGAGKPAYYQMFEFPFETMEALQAAMDDPGMKEVGADAAGISSGGEPIMLVGVNA